MKWKREEDQLVIKWLLGRMKKFRLRIGAITACFLFLGLLTFSRPQIIRVITDEGLLCGDMGVVLGASLLLVLLAVIEQILELIQNKLFLRLRNQTQYHLFDEIFARLLRMKKSYFDKSNSAEIMNTLNADVMSVSGVADRGVMYFFSYLLRILSGFVGLLYISPKLAALVLTVVPIKYLMVRVLSKKKRRLTENVLEEVRSFSAWFGDVINGIREIKLWNLYLQSISEFRKRQEKLIERDEALGMNEAFNQSAEMWLEWSLEAGLYICGGILLCNGELTLGSLFSFLSYSSYVTGPISAIFNLRMIFARIMPAAERLLTFMNEEREEDSSFKVISKEYENVVPEELCLRKVVFSYDKHEVLKGVDLKIRKGERVAIIGQNGSGKSTLINLLLRFLTPFSGEILLDGKLIEEIPLDEYRELFSVVSQEPYLFQGTAEENINLKGNLSEQEIREACRKSGAEDFLKGIDRITGQNGTKLSGGEKQKLAMARAIGKKAPILLLDEANAGLDPESDHYLSKVICEEFSDKMVLMITHRYENLKGFTHIYRLVDGLLEEIDEKGIEVQLKKRDSHYR